MLPLLKTQQLENGQICISICVVFFLCEVDGVLTVDELLNAVELQGDLLLVSGG